jgi:hypothetical protein
LHSTFIFSEASVAKNDGGNMGVPAFAHWSVAALALKHIAIGGARLFEQGAFFG